MSGFTVVLDDDFVTLNPAQWNRYSGTSSASGCAYDPSNVNADSGRLRLASARQTDGSWRGAGVKHQLDQLYGRWTVVSRIEAGRGVTLVHLLWPAAGTSWPPELDFAEDNGADRNVITGTNHWKDSAGAHQRQAITFPVDLTQWHTWQVEWTPGRVVYRCDGVDFATFTDPAQIPAVPMHLALQTEAWVKPTTWEHAVDDATPSRVSMLIDRVTVEKYTP